MIKKSGISKVDLFCKIADKFVNFQAVFIVTKGIVRSLLFFKQPGAQVGTK